MSDVVSGIPEVTETYPNGSPKTQVQDTYDRDTKETTTTETTYVEGTDPDHKGKRKSRTRIVRKAAPGPDDPRARRNKIREITEVFDPDGDQIVEENEITYDGTVNEIPKEKYERKYYTDPKRLKEQIRYSWDGTKWVQESHYKFDRDGTPHKQ